MISGITYTAKKIAKIWHNVLHLYKDIFILIKKRLPKNENSHFSTMNESKLLTVNMLFTNDCYCLGWHLSALHRDVSFMENAAGFILSSDRMWCALPHSAMCPYNVNYFNFFSSHKATLWLQKAWIIVHRVSVVQLVKHCATNTKVVSWIPIGTQILIKNV